MEDNLVNQRVLTKQLQKLGWTTHIANHGLEALAFLEQTQFWKIADGEPKPHTRLDLVLTDIEMPVMGGLECVREIRKLQVSGVIGRHVPVTAVSANARVEQISGMKDAGMVSFADWSGEC